MDDRKEVIFTEQKAYDPNEVSYSFCWKNADLEIETLTLSRLIGSNDLIITIRRGSNQLFIEMPELEFGSTWLQRALYHLDQLAIETPRGSQ